MSKFDKIQVGDKASLTHRITTKDIEKFVELTGDDNKLHLDSDFAGKTSFKKPVAHGMLGASFISTIIGTKLPGDGALWFSQSIDFLLPARVGDTLTITGEVLKKIPQGNILEIRTDIVNQHKQLITSGTAKVKVIEPETAKEKSGEIILKNKTAIVFGATGGIGSASAIALARNGYDIVIHYNSNESKAKSLAKEIEKLKKKSLIIKSDITDFNDICEAVKTTERKFGNISAIVNCATTKIPNLKFDKLEWNDIYEQINIHVKSVFNIAKCVFPSMSKNKSGRIINVTTLYTESTPPAELMAYVTAKSALNGLTKSLAVEFAPHGITVNLVSPGMTDTELNADVPEKTRLLTSMKTPLRRLAKPEDIAEAIIFLVSERSDFITGETIRVNGGQSML